MYILKANFIGKSALLSRLESPVFREVVMLRVESPDCDPEGDETILSCGTAVGFTTSGCYSPATGSGLALANLPADTAIPFQVNVFEKVFLTLDKADIEEKDASDEVPE